MNIRELDASYKGRRLVCTYETTCHYLPSRTDSAAAFGVTFTKTPFDRPVTKQFAATLLEEWWEAPRLFGVEHEGGMIAFLEVAHERWNNRLRITNLWVDAAHRRRGIGAMLVERAGACAIEAGARALVLETQSCNANAIALYRSFGFSFTGCDLTAYTNRDEERREVRLELAMRIRDAARILLADPTGRVLLFHFVYDWGALKGTDYWGVPGGGVEEGETPSAAAVRELREETGLRVDGVGPEVASGSYRFRLSDGEMVLARDHYHLLRTAERPALSQDGFTPEETSSLKESRWWSAEELAATGENIVPPNLAETLRRAGV